MAMMMIISFMDSFLFLYHRLVKSWCVTYFSMSPFFSFLVDSRVKPMVVLVKKWAKTHGINDASQGTLSSYALTLMVIHYLQGKIEADRFLSLSLVFFFLVFFLQGYAEKWSNLGQTSLVLEGFTLWPKYR